MSKLRTAITVWLAGVLLAPGASAGFSVLKSSQAAKMQEDLTRLSKLQGQVSDKQAFDSFFDSSASRAVKGEATPVALASLTSFQSNVLPTGTQLQPARSEDALGKNTQPGRSQPPAQKEVLSSDPGKKQKDLGTLKTTPDGNLYRATAEGLNWWDWFSPPNWFNNRLNERSIQKAVPNSSGATWNTQGEFVGDWKTVLKTDTENFDVAKGADGQDHIYTFKDKDWGKLKEVSRDGKLLTSFGSRMGNDELLKVKVGANDKVYAMYSTSDGEKIYGVDPATQRQALQAKVPLEKNVWDHFHHGWMHTHTYQHEHSERHDHDDGETHRHYENHTHYEDHWHPPRWHEHVDVFRAKDFEVTQDGRIMTLFKGNVYEESSKGSAFVTKQGNIEYYHGDPIELTPRGRHDGFKVDALGNLYTRDQDTLNVNESPTAVKTGEKILTDNNGNMFRVEQVWFDQYLRRVNAFNPSEGAQIAAPGKATETRPTNWTSHHDHKGHEHPDERSNRHGHEYGHSSDPYHDHSVWGGGRNW